MKITFLDGRSKEISDLEGADLEGADLEGADLEGADLRGAKLRGAKLQGANLEGANLEGAKLRGANLWGANLEGANLEGADLWGANLEGANLEGAEGLDSFCILPAGILTGYKKLANGTIAKLHIPAKAKRVNAYGSRKCRAEYATVVSGSGVDKHSGTVNYTKGKTVRPDSFDPDPRVGCSHGIHFFMTEQEAKDY